MDFVGTLKRDGSSLPSYQVSGTALRWLDTVFKKNGNLRFRSVFLENYYLFEYKEYFCYVKQHFHKSCTAAVAMATMTFQNGGYFLALK